VAASWEDTSRHTVESELRLASWLKCGRMNMFVVRRVWETKPGEARRAASLVAAMGEEYESADKRSPSRVYFNTGTVPGERNRVYMEWTEDVIASTYRADSVASPPRAQELYKKLNELTLDTWIEFYELMTPEKMTDVG